MIAALQSIIRDFITAYSLAHDTYYVNQRRIRQVMQLSSLLGLLRVSHKQGKHTG